MDATTEYLSECACRLYYEDLTPEAVHQVKRTLVDTLGCGMGAFDDEPPLIARRLASRFTGDPSARILGTRAEASVDWAAFANTVLIRYLDCNDTYAARGTGHPSDMIPAPLALARACRANGRDTITAIVVAYEVFCRLVDRVPLNGWDQGIFAVIGAACGAGKLLGLDRTAMGHAISMAITPSVPLGVTRIGELAMWKGCATGASIRAGVFAALLASEGMEGPGQPFEGRDGLWQHMGMEAPSWGHFSGWEDPFRIMGTTFKAYPAVVHTQGPIGLALELRGQFTLDEIEAIQVSSYADAVRRTGAEAEKWDPKTRETADHSMPYLVAAALQDGAITPATFTRSRIQDPSLRPLMQKIIVLDDPHLSHRYPAESCSRIEVTLRGGKKLQAETSHPKGNHRNPLSDGEVEAKFRSLTAASLDSSQQDAVLGQVWSLDQAEDLEALLDALVVERSRTGGR